jgi:hypothetical protein
VISEKADWRRGGAILALKAVFVHFAWLQFVRGAPFLFEGQVDLKAGLR